MALKYNVFVHRHRKLLRVFFWIVSIMAAAFVAGGFFLPRELEVSRSISIRAGAAEVFAHLESLREWPAWAPWFTRDPFVETEFTGPQTGRGSEMTWSSRESGTGRIKITAAEPHRSLALALDFGERGVDGEAGSVFALASGPDGTTQVTWTMSTDFGQNAARRYFGLLIRRDLARDLDEGLAKLKVLAESRAPSSPPDPP